jgi:hypothetical protein
MYQLGKCEESFFITPHLDSLPIQVVGYLILEVLIIKSTCCAASAPWSSSVPFYGASCSSSFYAI